MRQVAGGRVQLFPRHEMLDLVTIDGKARGLLSAIWITAPSNGTAPMRLCWPRDIASRAAKERIDAGFGAGPLKNAVYLDFSKAINEQGKQKIEEKYGNLFRMYEKITGINAYQEPMRISPAAHFSMGGPWVDYELMTNVPGLYAVGEANFADHGANRLGANSLLQACVDGYFIAPSYHRNAIFLAHRFARMPFTKS
jgi:succinate dehydrogenase/fumarate reductase flavoprotein subunit